MSTELILLLLIVTLASFVQTSTGFGLALVSVPLLTAVIGLQTAAPFVSLFAIIVELILLLRYREDIHIRPVLKLVLGAAVGIPIGLYLLNVVDPVVGAKLLGGLLVVYVIYAFVTPRLPQLNHSIWAYSFGFVAGLLGGIFAISGPPVIMYSSCQRWSPQTFKGNLQGFFLPVSLMILLGHLFDGNVTSELWRYALFSIPAIIVGIVLGLQLDGRINPNTFRKIVLVLLLFIGLRLIFT